MLKNCQLILKQNGLHCLLASILVLSIYCEMNDFGGEKMARITKDQVKHVAHLARLSITEEETELFTKQLDAIISFSELLNEVDTENVQPTTHVLNIRNVMRDDEVRQSLPREDALKNAPDHQDGQVKVPSILE